MKISIITAVFNNAGTVAQALDSVLSQTYPDVELVVIDGASTDGTQKVLSSYRDRLGVYFSEPDGGIYEALNKGLARAKGDVIGFLHADDLLASPQVLAQIAEVFRDTDIQGVYGDLLYVSKQDPSNIVRYWRSRKFSRDMLAKGWMPAHPTLYLRRGVYEKYGNFDTCFRIAADYDFMLRILSADTLRFYYLPTVLVHMRVGGASNRSVKNLWRKSSEDWRALRKNRIGSAWTLIRKNLSKLSQFLTRPS